MTLSTLVAVAGSVEILALLAVLVALCAGHGGAVPLRIPSRPPARRAAPRPTPMRKAA